MDNCVQLTYENVEIFLKKRLKNSPLLPDKLVSGAAPAPPTWLQNCNLCCVGLHLRGVPGHNGENCRGKSPSRCSKWTKRTCRTAMQRAAKAVTQVSTTPDLCLSDWNPRTDFGSETDWIDHKKSFHTKQRKNIQIFNWKNEQHFFNNLKLLKFQKKLM